MKNFNKVVKTLILANSDAREETIKSIIEDILYPQEKAITLDELKNSLKKEFKIEIHETELKNEIINLVELKNLILLEGRYSMSNDRHRNLTILISKAHDEEDKRKINFKNALVQLSKAQLTDELIQRFWLEFTEYIYDCFFHFGKEAINMFFPKRFQNKESSIDDSLVNIYSKKFTGQVEQKLFEDLVREFPNLANSATLEYLEVLARKTESFYSLGLSVEEYSEIQKIKFTNWTFIVDTNFLYSILNLHKNIETPACHEIMELNKKNKLGFKFRYTHRTLQELMQKKDEIESYISKESYTNSQIEALLKSDKLDPFSKSYFERKLENPSSTPHPLDIINTAQFILKSKGIEIINSKFESLTDNEHYFLDRVSNYNTYVQSINEARLQKGLDYRPRDIHQIEHDVFIREVIEQLRGGIRMTTMSEVKYIGLTLDRTLLNYDKFDLGKRKSGATIPNFFSPSFLLKCLIKLSPVVTDDYRRAFLSAISSNAFTSNPTTSKNAQNLVAYFKNLGIDDEALIISLLQSDVFLNEFSITPVDEKEDFIQSELSKRVKEYQEKAESAQIDLNKAMSILDDSHQENISLSQKVKKIEGDLAMSKAVAINYKKAIEHLKASTPAKDNTEELNKLKGENLKLKNQVRKPLRDKFIWKKIFMWRFRTLFYIILGLAFFAGIICYVCRLGKWDFTKISALTKDYLNNVIIAGTLWVCSIFFTGFFIKRFSDQFNQSTINAFKNKIENDLPEDLRDLQDD